MTRPSQAELDRLRAVAGEICETMEADGYLVTRAVDNHASFRDGRGPSGSLERALVKHAAERGASRAGVHAERRTGGLELVSIDGRVQRTYRIKTATRKADGELDLVCGAGSTLLKSGNGESMFLEENWVLGFVTTDDHTIDEILVAQVIGHYGENPVHLILSDPIALTPAPSPLGFTSSDEDDLPGFEDDNDADEGDTGVA